MFKFLITLLLVSSISSAFACERLSQKNTAHVQTWLTLLVTRDLGMVAFTEVGKIKVAALPSFAKLKSIEVEQPEVQAAIEHLARGMHKYIATKWSVDTHEDISLAIESKLRDQGTVCDLANELDMLMVFKEQRGR